MNFYASSPSNTVNNETNNLPSSFSSSFHIWQQPVTLQGYSNPSMIHAVPQSVTPTVPQHHVAQPYAPFFTRPLIYVYQEHRGQFSVQGDAGREIHTLPQNLAPTAVSQRQIAHVNVSMPPQPPHHVYQDTFPVQGDYPSHVPSNAVSVSPIKTETTDDQKRYMCPHCKRRFKRTQELKRHLQSSLPDSILCPFPFCPWTGRRQYSLKNRMKVHPNPDPYKRKEFQIYDPEKLVQLMASGNLTIKRAADIALLKVKKRFEKYDKVDVKASVWGNGRKVCTARSWS